MKNIATAILLLAMNCAMAEYVVTGKVEGSVCRGIGIQMCSMKQIDAVKGSDGRLYTVASSFKTVSEYKQEKNRCWINTKSTGGGIFSWGINAVSQPDFYEKTESGEFNKIDVEYVTFPCSVR